MARPFLSCSKSERKASLAESAPWWQFKHSALCGIPAKSPGSAMGWHTLHSKPTLAWRLWLNTTGCLTGAGGGSALSPARDPPVAAASMLRRTAVRVTNKRIIDRTRNLTIQSFMPLCGATTDEKSNDSSLGRGKGRQALEWAFEATTHPVWRRDRCRGASHPSQGDFHWSSHDVERRHDL